MHVAAVLVAHPPRRRKRLLLKVYYAKCLLSPQACHRPSKVVAKIQSATGADRAAQQHERYADHSRNTAAPTCQPTTRASLTIHLQLSAQPILTGTSAGAAASAASSIGAQGSRLITPAGSAGLIYRCLISAWPASPRAACKIVKRYRTYLRTEDLNPVWLGASSASMTKYPREAVDEVPPKPCSASSTALGGGRVDNRNGLARQRHRDRAIR